MKKLDLYLLKKFLVTFFFILGIIMLIAVIFDISERVDSFTRLNPSIWLIASRYYFNFIIFYGNLFSSLIVFIAVIWFTSTMASKTEIVAILSSGISFRRMMLPYFIGATFLGAISLYLNHYVVPNANETRQQFEREWMAYKHFFSDYNIHLRISDTEFAFIDSYNSTRNSGFKFAWEQWEDNQLKFKINADHILYDTAEHIWVMDNVKYREINGLEESIYYKSKVDTNFPFTPKDFIIKFSSIETLTTPELNEFIEQEKSIGSDNVPYWEVAKHERSSYPFATYIMTLIGVSIASKKVRGGIGLHLMMGLVICLLYIFTMKITTIYATNAGLDPLIAVWLPNILFGLLGGYLYSRAYK